MESPSLFDESVSRIEAAYISLGHSMGWRFLNVARDILAREPRIALITTNPGGMEETSGQGMASCDHGCAYRIERWGSAAPGASALQKQVRAMFGYVARHSGSPRSGDALMEDSLIGYYVPFRSPDWESLPRKAESLAFAQGLWASLLGVVRPGLILTIDATTFEGVRSILRAQEPSRAQVATKMSTGWGNASAVVEQFGSGDDMVTLVRLPHLSRYKLFSRDDSEPHLEEIFSLACGSSHDKSGSATAVASTATSGTQKVSTPSLEVRIEPVGSRLHRMRLFSAGTYIGEYEKSQAADIQRKCAEIEAAAELLLQCFKQHGEFRVRWDGKNRTKSIRVAGVEVGIIPKEAWKAPSWQRHTRLAPDVI